jgi:class 3 adenylate cyclase/putative methionine-R-sulfoxide reductase with GAF domain
MAQLSLERLLRQHDTAAAMQSLFSAVGGIQLEDLAGTRLLGDAAGETDDVVRVAVKNGEETIGWVVGAPSIAEALGQTMSWAAATECARKQLGAELLNSYREINFIHNFSEELAKLLDQASVAKATTDQACRIVDASFATLLMKNETTGMFEPMVGSNAGTNFVSVVTPGVGLIGAIVARGNAEIVNDVRADTRCSDCDPAVHSMICVPLKMKEQILGVLVVGSVQPATYAAGDLKMMSTLAIQAATALENALLYERTLDAVKTEVLEKMLVEVEGEKRKAEATLRNILPESVASELQTNGFVQPMYFEDVTVVFTDFVGFSKSTMSMAAEEVVQELNRYFTAFDRIIERYKLEKLKTIGDSYMFASGLPTRHPSHPIDAVLAALEIVQTVKQLCNECKAIGWNIRVGLHTGPVVAGVVGIHKFAFDVWGETVNIASRMESCGEANRVNISERTFVRVKDFFVLEPRGRVRTKEGQELEMYFVERVLDRLVEDCSACPPPLFESRYRLYFREASPSFPAYLLESKSSD